MKEASEKWYYSSVEAEIQMLSEKQSIRKNGITSGYRPNHNFGSPDNVDMRMGIITVHNDEWIELGQSKKAKVDFIMPENYLIDLVLGLKWRIQEGGELVGYGIIKRIISPYQLKK